MTRARDIAGGTIFTSADHTKLDGIATGATAYVHPTGSGNNHIPAAGAAGQLLQYASAGTAAWATVSSNPYTAQSTAATGYITLVGGLIIQWGKIMVGGGGTSQTATFAIAFPNAVHSVTTSKGNGASIDNGTFSTTSAQFYNNGGFGNASNVYYIAIGH